MDTGDALTGPFRPGRETKGQLIVEAMNLMGYAAMAIGPRELELGLAVLRQRMAEAQFAMVSANVFVRATGEQLAPAYFIWEGAGQRVGIIGLARVPEQPSAEFDVRDPLAALAPVVKELEEKADLIVLLSNADLSFTTAVAGLIPGIDIAIGARAESDPVGVINAPGTQTLVVVAERPIRTPSTAGRRVGRLVVAIQPGGACQLVEWNSAWMDPTVPDDPAMDALIAKYGW